MDCQRHHLRDSREAGDGTVICRVLPVTSFKDKDCTPLEEPDVLLVPPVLDLPFDCLLHRFVHHFSDLLALLVRGAFGAPTFHRTAHIILEVPQSISIFNFITHFSLFFYSHFNLISDKTSVMIQRKVLKEVRSISGPTEPSSPRR